LLVTLHKEVKSKHVFSSYVDNGKEGWAENVQPLTRRHV
jgi:hypothetical protein